MQKVRIGVLMGGKSREREVSFNSGRTICDHIDTARYEVIPLFQTINGSLYILPWSFLHRGKISDFEHKLQTYAQQIEWDALRTLIDIAYIAMHGRYAEDGTMQGMLELFNIPYIGSKILASALGMDKIVQKKVLAAAHVQVAKDFIVYPYEPIDQHTLIERMQAEHLLFDCVVKPYKEGSSLGVSIAHTYDELQAAVEKARFINGIAQAVLVEEKINGMEFSCIVLINKATDTYKAFTPTEIVPDKRIQFFDYEQKYMPGRSEQHTPARCLPEHIDAIKGCAIEVCKALDFQTIARIDGFLKPNGHIVITDPNSFSGAAPSSFLFKQAAEAGLSHTQLINHLIKIELAHYYKEGIMKPIEQEQLSRNTPKIKVGVLLGGDSNEKEISLESGRNVIFKLSPEKYEAIPLFVSSSRKLYILNPKLLVCSSTKEIEEQLASSQDISWHSLPTLIDFAFIALHGGVGENGSVQGLLEILGIPYNGSSVLSSALCMNKYKTNSFLRSQMFNVPDHYLLSKHEWDKDIHAALQNIYKNIVLPCVVKPHDDGCSVMVRKATTESELIGAIEHIFFNGKQYALIEELINGIELTGGVVGNAHPYALPPSQAVASGGILSIEEKFLPGAGENQTPAPLEPSALQFVSHELERVYKVVDCKGYARIDCFYQDAQSSPTGAQRVVILEINTLPGLTPATCIFHQAAEIGLRPMEFIDLIIKLGFEEHSAQTVKESAIDQLMVKYKMSEIHAVTNI